MVDLKQHRERIARAIVAELRRQESAPTAIKPMSTLNVWYVNGKLNADVNGIIDLDALAAAIAEIEAIGGE